MEDNIILKGRLEPKSNILSHPEFYKNTAMLCFVLPEAYKAPFMKYFIEHGMKDYQEITIKNWPLEVTERAKKLFFTIRDRVAVHTEGENVTRDYKEHLYRSCIEELGLTEKGKRVRSLKTLSKRDMHMATELMIQWAYEAEAYIADLVPEMKAVRQDLKEKE